MIKKIISFNKKKYIEYNNFRKKAFCDFAPRESEVVLYLIPWLLCVNHLSCPGYVSDLKVPFRVFNIDDDNEIRNREAVFKRRFNIKNKESLLKPSINSCIIHGLYTIGSIGTVSQGTESDCDVWLCYDSNDFNGNSYEQLNQKINLIKDWLDIHLKIPVYFFVSDIKDIKNSFFGNIDSESSGSAQKNVLKEEFYRTCMVICGKIPLWWLCYYEGIEIDYSKAAKVIRHKKYWEYDIIDFGNIEKVDKSEYFGAALWQLHKSLVSPLKSIFKMINLYMLIAASDEKLLCHQFRKQIVGMDKKEIFHDPIVFMVSAIFKYFQDKKDFDTLALLKDCFYLRCKLKPYSRKQGLKKKLVNDLFKKYPIDIKRKIMLGNFNSWALKDQIQFTNRIFNFLFLMFEKNFKHPVDIASKHDEQDIVILKRKISAGFRKKENKISVLHKQLCTINYPTVNICLENMTWQLFLEKNKAKPLIASKNIVYIIAFIVANSFYSPTKIHMDPNPSPVTLQEIISLGKKIKVIFGYNDISQIELHNYLKKAYINKILIVISFDKSSQGKNINDFDIIYKNSWGELFVMQLDSPKKLNAFIRKFKNDNKNIEINYYMQRNCSYYEKIIERTKKTAINAI